MSTELLLARIKDLSSPMQPLDTGHPSGLKTLEGIKCVAFDFYGTMFISGVGDIGIDEGVTEEGIAMFEDALSDCGYELNNNAGERGLRFFEKHIQHYQESNRSETVDIPEPDIREIWEMVLSDLSENGSISGEVNAEKAERFAVEYEFRFNAVWPMPGSSETLDQIRDSGFKLGIISNSQFYTPLAFQALTGNTLEETGFDPDVMIWSYEAGVKKPSVHFYKRFEEQLAGCSDIRMNEVLFVGNDMLKDIYPASQMGMKTALFAGDRRSLKLRKEHAGCKDLKPDLVLSDLRQLVECLAED